MDNVNKYLEWRGDIPFDEKYSLNEVDSLILARFSYLPFYKINFKGEKTLTISAISKKMIKLDDSEFIYDGDKELITKLGKSERFKNLIVSDSLYTNKINNEEQFGAVTIHLPFNEIYVSYVGTDFSINGWKEDCNMAFMDVVPCQKLGKDYLEKIASKYPDKIRIGGHSKGGNVAIYSYVTVNNEIKNRVIKVYNYDGPGFNRYISNKMKLTKVYLNKIQGYIPQESIVGRLLNHIEKCQIVKSDNKGFLQHDIYSWEVTKDNVVTSDRLTDKSEIINDTLTKWLEDITPEKRKLFVDFVFDLLYSTDTIHFEDMTKNLSKSIIKIFKSYSGINEDEKKEFLNMIKLFLSTYINESKSREISKIEEKKREKTIKNKSNLKKIDAKLRQIKRKKKRNSH